jgi:hypothetical protein
MVKAKIDKGIYWDRGNVGTSNILHLLLFALDRFFALFSSRSEKLDTFSSWLSKETLRKMNHPQFKTFIRIAAPQRWLPTLAKPFTGGDGDNQLVINFLPRKEQIACMKEMNTQQLSLYSKTDLNPNLMSSGELSRLVPLFSRQVMMPDSACNIS